MDTHLPLLAPTRRHGPAVLVARRRVRDHVPEQEQAPLLDVVGEAH